MSTSFLARELAWDQRLARRLVAPLAATPVHPNHLTTLGLAIGLSGAALMAQGGGAMAWGAGLFMLAAFMDHADGELARLAGKTSRFGHYYDRVCAATSYVTGFIGMGLGLRHGALGGWAILIGVAAGLSITAIFMVRNQIERRAGKTAIKQRNFLGFEIEDVLYVFGPVIWAGWLAPVLTATAVGAPIFLAWSLIELRRRGAAAPPGDPVGGT